MPPDQSIPDIAYDKFGRLDSAKVNQSKVHQLAKPIECHSKWNEPELEVEQYLNKAF